MHVEKPVLSWQEATKPGTLWKGCTDDEFTFKKLKLDELLWVL